MAIYCKYSAPTGARPSGDTRYIVDFIHAGETLVHQIGCHTEPNDGHRSGARRSERSTCNKLPCPV